MYTLARTCSFFSICAALATVLATGCTASTASIANEGEDSTNDALKIVRDCSPKCIAQVKKLLSAAMDSTSSSAEATRQCCPGPDDIICDAHGQRCQRGISQMGGVCQLSEHCANDLVCSDGACAARPGAQCRASSDCAVGLTCQHNVCAGSVPNTCWSETLQVVVQPRECVQLSSYDDQYFQCTPQGFRSLGHDPSSCTGAI